MKRLVGKVDSLHLGVSEEMLGKEICKSLDVHLSGFAEDRHNSFERQAWAGDDKQAEGTRRRNERQWSAVSVEELAEISDAMDLQESLSAADLGANLCLSGIPKLSHLPKGSIIRFPSGAELIVEEYNPPCLDMGKYIAANYNTNSGDKLADVSFSAAAKYSRGLVGVVEVPGVIAVGDDVIVIPYKAPAWANKGR